MLPIDLEILKYILFEKPLYAYKIRPYLRTVDYTELKIRLENYQRDESLLTKDLSTAPFTIFDLETTGLLPEVGHEIISIGAIRIYGTQHIQYERFHQHIYPIRPVPKRTLELTGISREDLKNGHSFCDAYYNFLEFSKDTILVAYPAAFDMNFLQTMLKRWKLPVKTPYSVDAQSLVKQLYPNNKIQLDTIISDLGISKLERHHALNDATMTAELFQKLLQDCMDLGMETPGELINYAQKKS